MHSETKQLIISTRQTLHALAELPGQERQTQAFIRDFLRRHSSLELVDCGTWLYARHDEGAEKTLVVRADHDAVPTPCGPKHLCGHDGHTAALLGLALLLEGRRIGKNVILLFQPAEETGAGAEACCALFAREGLKNVPVEPLIVFSDNWGNTKFRLEGINYASGYTKLSEYLKNQPKKIAGRIDSRAVSAALEKYL